MTVARPMDLRANLKKYLDVAFHDDVVFVPRKNNENVYVISQAEYEDLLRAKRNAEYLEKLDRSFNQLAQGRVVNKTMEELEAMANE